MLMCIKHLVPMVICGKIAVLYAISMETPVLLVKIQIESWPINLLTIGKIVGDKSIY